MKKRLLFSTGILLAIALAITGVVYASGQRDEVAEAPEAPEAVQTPDIQTENITEPAIVPNPDEDVLVKDTTPPPTIEERVADYKKHTFDVTGITGLDFSTDAVMWRIINQIRQDAEEVLWYKEQGANFSERELQYARERIELSEELGKMYSDGAEIDDVLTHYLIQIDIINGLE